VSSTVGVGMWARRADGRPDAIPRYATPRRHDRPSHGARKARVARSLGQPFMPWQAALADVAGEYHPDTGVPCYDTVIVTVPRQSGKTTTVLTEAIDRAVNWPTLDFGGGRLGRQRIVYTAQTGQDAREKMLEEQLPLIEDSEILRKLYSGTDRSKGAERIRFKNGSTYRPIATTKKSGHGPTVHMAFIDEAFAEGAVGVREAGLDPSMVTIETSQLWILSTVGTEESIYFNGKIELGRAAVLEGRSDGICYVEFSAEDPDVDINDESVWWKVMPALGYSQTIEKIRARRDKNINTPGEFRRAYLNIPTVNLERVISAEAWAAICDPSVELGDEVVIGVDADPELVRGSVVVCDRDSVLELVDEVPIGELLNLAVRVALHTGAPIVLDAGGPLTAKVHDIEHELGADRVIKAGAADLVQASAEFYTAIGDRELTVLTDDRFDRAVGAAGKRKIGDRWTWVRHPDAIPLVAASLARWARRHAPEPHEPEPDFFSL